MDFITKDSGQREEFSSGMVRDTQQDKTRYDLVDFELFDRWAQLMTRGAKKYGDHNWKKANSVDELHRFRASAMRHFYQWFYNLDNSEDHAAAVCFNISGAEMVARKLNDNDKPLSF